MIHKPGCFAMALQHSKIKTCNACAHLSDCRAEAGATLRQLDGRPNVRSLVRSYYKDVVRHTMTLEDSARYESLPVKSKELVRRFGLGRSKLDIYKVRAASSAEIPEQFRLVINSLFDEHGVTKRDAVSMLMQRMGIAKRTAESYVSAIFALIESDQVAIKSGQSYRINLEAL